MPTIRDDKKYRCNCGQEFPNWRRLANHLHKMAKVELKGFAPKGHHRLAARWSNSTAWLQVKPGEKE